MTPNTFQGLFWSYLIVWGLIVLYLFWLGHRVKKIEKLLSNDE